MISRYAEILHYSKLINHELDNVGQVQKIYSTSYYLSFQIRVRGKSIYLLLGRGGGFEGIFFSSANPISALRKRDKWLEWLRKHVAGSLILKIEVDEIDRCLALVLQKGGVREKVYIAWIGRLSYFAHEVDGEIIFKSWARGSSALKGFDVFDEVGRRQINLKQEVREIEGDQLLQAETTDASKDKQLSKKAKKRKIKIDKIQNDIERLSKWKDLKVWLEEWIVEEAECPSELNFQGLRIKLPMGQTPFQKRDFLFQKMKALKDAEKMQMMRLEQEESLIATVQTLNTLKTISPVWGSNEVKKQAVISEGEYKIIKQEGYSVGIGQSAEGNDRLRKNWSKDEDIWVHAAQGKSAHAIIKLNSGVSFSIEMITKAAKLILKQSGKESGTLEVVYTQVKYVKGVSGQVGMVTFKKEKRITIVASEKSHE